MHQYQLQRAIREETDANLKTTHVLGLYLNRQYENLQGMLQQVYSDGTVSDDMVYFLDHDYETYLGHRLNAFASSAGSRNRTFDLVIKNYLEQDAAVRSVSVYSYAERFSMYVGRTSRRIDFDSGADPVWKEWADGGRAGFRGVPASGRIPGDSQDDEGYAEQDAAVETDSGGAVPAVPGAWAEDVPRRDAAGVPEERTEAQSGQTGGDRYVYTRELQDPWTLRRIGLMVVEFDAAKLDALLQSQAPAGSGQILVLAADGTAIYDSEDRYAGQIYPYRPDASGETELPGDAFRTNELGVAGSGLSVLGVVSEAAVDRSMAGLTGMLILGTVLFAAASIGFAAVIIRSHSKKVRRIIRSTSRIGAGDLTTRIEMSGEDELQQIAQRINAMCGQLETYIDQVYTSEIRQKNAELALLQSQINPHFLYNTLESIRMKAYSSGAQDVGKMIYSLSVMFRSLVKKSTVVSVGEEIEICSMYLDLFRIRYEGRLEAKIEADEAAKGCRIVKLLVQPIAENYIVHGFRPLDDDNRVAVRAKVRNGRLTIAVEDNGSGIAPDRLAEIRLMLGGGAPAPDKEHRSIGLINVHERIRMNYGESYGLTVDSEEGRGTVVRMELPAIGEEASANLQT
ncbi:two-component sensor histidine kinase [Saccharibacillus sp. O23]|nr:two-component sensor histidine kinase [Saccharibacillus sp. O23]